MQTALVKEDVCSIPAEPQITHFTGIEYLMIDVASSFGLDKEEWETRIQWTKDNLDELLSLVHMDMTRQTPRLLKEADEPAMLYAGVQALDKALRGEPTGYAIGLDATASGLQLLSLLSGCAQSAMICNAIPNAKGKRMDAYTHNYGAMKSIVPLNQRKDLERAQAKDALMTALYGSTAVPRRHFGDGALLEAFYKTVQKELPGAWSLNLALQTLWKPMALSHDWVLPDNFHCHIKERNIVQHFVTFMGRPMAVDIKINKGAKEGRSISPNLIHSIDGLVVREILRRCSYDMDHIRFLTGIIESGSYLREPMVHREADKMVELLWRRYLDSGFLSARILDYLDDFNMALVDVVTIAELIFSLPSKPFDVITVHDCFRVLPSYGNDIRKQYNRILSGIAGSKMLEELVQQVSGKHQPVVKMADLSAQVLNAEYALS